MTSNGDCNLVGGHHCDGIVLVAAERNQRTEPGECQNSDKNTKHASHPTSIHPRRWKRCKATTLAAAVGCYAFVWSSLTSNPAIVLYDETHQTAVTGGSLFEAMLPHLRDVGSGLSRVYRPVPPSTWCVDDMLALDQLKRRPMGLCYLKVPRAAGGTLKGINMRIARAFGERQGIGGCIRHDSDTVGASYGRRDPLSYLWTFVRDPTDRAMSVLGKKLSDQYALGRDGTTRESYILNPADGDDDDDDDGAIPALGDGLTNYANATSNDRHRRNATLMNERAMTLLRHSNNIHDGVLSEGRGGFQLQFGMQHYIEADSAVDPMHPTEPVNPPAIQEAVRATFNRYDFVGVVERFDESLVLMQLLLGLEASDVLYFATNTRRQFQRAKVGRGRFVCRKNFDWEHDVLTLGPVREYVRTDPEWFTQNYGDYLLYQAANQSLDETILRIGLDVYVEALRTFRRLLREARETCRPKFQCSDDGRDQPEEAATDCLVNGRIGCADRCLDGVAARAFGSATDANGTRTSQ